VCWPKTSTNNCPQTPPSKLPQMPLLHEQQRSLGGRMHTSDFHLLATRKTGEVPAPSTFQNCVLKENQSGYFICAHIGIHTNFRIISGILCISLRLCKHEHLLFCEFISSCK
jgi:hypothetical protein